MQCVSGLYLTVAEPLAPLPIKNDKKKFLWLSPIAENEKVFANFPRGFWRFLTKFQWYKKQCCPGAEDWAILEDLRL